MKWLSLQHRLRLKFLIGTCLMAIIPIIIFSVISYKNATSNLQNELGRAKIETLKQVQKRIDHQLITLNKNIIQHIFTTSLDQFISSEDLLNDLYVYREMKSLLITIEVLVDNVQSVALYLTKTDQIVFFDEGIRPAAEFMDRTLYEKIQQNKEPYFWVDDLNESPSDRKRAKQITYVRALPIGSDHPKGYIIVRLQDRAFFEVYDEMDMETQSEMLIITPSGTVFSDWNRDLLQDDLSVYPLITRIQNGEPLKSSTFQEKMEGQQMLVSAWQSPFNDWTYVSIVPTSEVFAKFHSIKQMTIIVCAVFIVISIIASLMLSKNFYRGIKSIVDRIKGKLQWSDEKEHHDEIRFINSYMDTIQDLNVSLSNEVDRSRPLLASNFIQSILLEHVSQKEIEQQFDYFDLPRLSPMYTVFCLELVFEEDLSEADLQLFLYAASNICEELFPEHSPGLVTKVGHNQIAMIMNHGTVMEKVQLKNAFEYGERVIECVTDVLRLKSSIGMGRTYGQFDLRKSFSEARNALQYRFVIGTGQVIYVDRVEPMQASNQYEYPYELEQQMILQMKVGQLEQVKVLLDEFTKRLSQLHADQIRLAYSQLVFQVIREFYESAPEDSSLLVSGDVLEKLGHMHTIDRTKQWVYDHIFVVIAKYYEGIRNDQSHKTMEHALQYIHDHYDEDLSQPLLAEILEISPSHLAQMFKDDLGMSFSEYILMFRMDQAKEWLLETDMKILEIAERLRYNNSQNFIRTFKKMNGMTPGEFRVNGRTEE